MKKTAGTFPAVFLFLVIGAVINLLPLETGTPGFLLAGAMLLAVSLTRGGRLPVLRRVGAYLVGGGLAGILLLGSMIARIHNICGTGAIHLSEGQAYECYSIETLWAVVVYGVMAAVGTLLLFRDWRQGRTREMGLS